MFLAFTAEGPGSIPGGGTKIPQAVQCEQKERKEHHIDSSWLRDVTVHSRDQPAVPPTSMSLMMWIQSSQQFF